MSTAFQNQGCQMQLFLGTTPVPVSALNLFDTLAILLLLPLFDGYIYPYFQKRGKPLSMLTKIGWGFIFAGLAMAAAALLEVARLHYAPAAGDWTNSDAVNNISPCQDIDDYDGNLFQLWYQDPANNDEPAYCSATCDVLGSDGLLSPACIDCDDIPQMSNINVFWQIPQFVLIGVSEILASITSLEFFYSQAPSSMRSVTQSFNLATSALGSFVTIPLIYFVNINKNDEWLPTNLDQGHLTYYFMVLGICIIADLAYFWWISQGYVYKTNAELQINDLDDYQLVSSSSPPASPNHKGSAAAAGSGAEFNEKTQVLESVTTPFRPDSEQTDHWVDQTARKSEWSHTPAKTDAGRDLSD